MRSRGRTAAARAAQVLLVVSAWLAGGPRTVAAEVEVEIEGLPPNLEQNALAFLSIAELAEEPEPAAGDDDPDAAGAFEARVRRLHAAADREIAAALQPFGYYEPTIQVSLEAVDDVWQARYVVVAGPPTRLAEVEIEVTGEGSDTVEVRAARRSITLAQGEVLNHVRYEAAKEALFNAAYNAGFIDAVYRRAELRVDRGAREARIALSLDTGPRYYFGELRVEQEILSETFIERLVPIRPGEPFDTDRLLQLQIALNDSGYFNEVTIDVERERALDRRIPVVVRTTPRRTQEYTLGLGYGTDTGPRVSIGVELRRINPYGHRFNADLRLSNIEQAIAAEYRIPRGRNLLTDFVALRGSLGNQEIGDWDTRQQALGASWHDAWRSFQRRIYINGQRETFSTTQIPEAIEDLLYGGMQLTRKVADDPLFPRRGYSWSVDLRAGRGVSASGTTFGRLHASANIVRSLGERVRVLLRAEYGAIEADRFVALPPSQRFYAGGDGSVRGYGYQTLGPVDGGGARIGGRYLLVASAELEVRVAGDYGVAVFADAGNAADSAWPSLSRGAGIGARWRSPVGVVGIDIAHPFDDPDTDFRVHLSVGADL